MNPNGIGAPALWLRLLVLLCGCAVGLIVTFAPVVQFAASPDLVDLFVGWLLLVCGILVAGQPEYTVAGWVLTAAGASWFLTDLARVSSDVKLESLDRAGLVHLGALGCSVLLLPSGALSNLRTRVAAMSFVALGFSGWTGGWEFLLPMAGVGLGAAGLSMWRRPGIRINEGRPWGAAVGILSIDLVGAALVRIAPGTFPESLLIGAHETTISCVAALLVVSAMRDGRDAIDVSIKGIAELPTRLAAVLAVPRLSVALAGDTGGWLDVGGATASVEQTHPTRARVVLHNGVPLALLGSDDAPIPPIPSQVIRVLRLARDHARLRAKVTQQVSDLDESRRRLLGAQDEARQDVYTTLFHGPLLQLADVERKLVALSNQHDLHERAVTARRDLEGLALGLDPVGVSGTLAGALQRLVNTCPSRVELSVDDTIQLTASDARTVWFTVSEGLSNAVKHAPKAAVNVRLYRKGDSVVVEVDDDGPGTVDASGRGLRGLADRAETLGCRLRVVGRPGVGSRLELTL